MLRLRFAQLSGFLIGGFVIFLLVPQLAFAGPKPDILQLKRQEISLSSRPVSFSKASETKKIFGRLIYRGGFNIYSSSPFWGGLSGIALSNNGTHGVAVSDAGFWTRFDLSYDKAGLLSPLKRAVVGPIMALKNRPLKRGRDRDAEAITLLKAKKFFSHAYISFEQNHRVGRFVIGKEGLVGPKSYLKMASITRRLSGNAGLEALSVLRGGKLKGALVAIAQSRKDAKGNFIGWLLHKGKVRKLRFVPPKLDKYRITDAVSLPNGDLVLLERRYKFFKINIRLRLVKQKELRRGKPIAGQILMEANSSEHRVDNMEGLAVHTNKRGNTILTLLSDDNFNSFQETLFMQFLLPPH